MTRSVPDTYVMFLLFSKLYLIKSYRFRTYNLNSQFNFNSTYQITLHSFIAYPSALSQIAKNLIIKFIITILICITPNVVLIYIACLPAAVPSPPKTTFPLAAPADLCACVLKHPNTSRLGLAPGLSLFSYFSLVSTYCPP